MYLTDYVYNAAGDRLPLWELPVEPPDINEPEIDETEEDK